MSGSLRSTAFPHADYPKDATTANSLAFGIWELAKNLDLQQRLRAEIFSTLDRIQEKSDKHEITFSEYENMPLLVAFMKVSNVSDVRERDAEQTPGSLQVSPCLFQWKSSGSKGLRYSFIPPSQTRFRSIHQRDTDIKRTKTLGKYARIQSVIASSFLNSILDA